MKVSEAIKNQFIVYSLSSFLVYFIFTSIFPITQTSSSFYVTFLNIINAAGGLFLVTGLYDVILKDKFQEETITSFVKTLLLENDYLKKFDNDEIEKMILKLENKLLKDNKNKYYKNKLINLIHKKLLPMGSGNSTHEELNTFFEYYNEELIYDLSKDKKFINCKVITEYKLINNSDDEITQTIFTRKFLDPKISEYDGVALELEKLEVVIDGTLLSEYNDSSQLKNMFTVVNELNDSISISNEEPLKMQIKEKIKIEKTGEELQEFRRKFKNSIIVKKELKIVIPYEDIMYGHTFHRPMLNYTFRFTDNNAKKVVGILRSAFHKKTDDTITVNNPQDNIVIIKLNNDLLLPKEGINVVSIR
ncbi:MAG: hypothetical protein HWD90_05770 [Campylobacteraceae bacterium]|nr:hypothetical protein [Campylobacteraceae bacterium]